MVLAILFSFTVVSAGFATLRTLGLVKGAVALGLAAPTGLAVLAVVSTLTVLVGAPPPLPGVVVLAFAAAGLGFGLRDRQSMAIAARMLAREHRLSAATLLAAVVVPFVAMGFAFAGAQVPLSPHDGAYHVEAIHAYRLGQAWVDWYPPGLATIFAAFLQLFPAVDSAEGAFDLGLSLPSLAAMAIFGLGVATWHDLRIASVAALLLGSTYVYPYFPQLWSGWPLAASIVLVVGLWTVSLEYIKRPSVRWGVLAGLALGAVVLVHGSELYTLLVVLAVVLGGALQRVGWRALPRDVGIALAVALLCSAIYLPTLLHWAASGGAGYGASVETAPVAAAVASDSANLSLTGGPDLFTVFGVGALGIDLPLRLVLLIVGTIWVFRLRGGRSVAVVGGLFAAIAWCFTTFGGTPVLRQVYAATFPWGMHYRLFMVVAVSQALLAGAGAVAILRWVGRLADRPNPWARRLGRAGRLVVLTWLGLIVWATTLFLSFPAGLVLGYGSDDAAAMAWLRQNAMPGSVVANDGYADAGIWAPYKAGLPILLPRSASSEISRQASLVIDNVGRLDQVPAAAAVACAQHVRYVYRGSRVSQWDARRFPTLADLRASPALEEVFASGEAVVFRTRLACLPN